MLMKEWSQGLWTQAPVYMDFFFFTFVCLFVRFLFFLLYVNLMCIGVNAKTWRVNPLRNPLSKPALKLAGYNSQQNENMKMNTL